MEGVNFVAIDFETATSKHASICEAGICVVKDGKIVETQSWLVRPEDNAYAYWNIKYMAFVLTTLKMRPSFPKFGRKSCLI